MLHLRSHALHGMVGGLAAGFVVALWFFLADVVSGQVLRTRCFSPALSSASTQPMVSPR